MLAIDTIEYSSFSYAVSQPIRAILVFISGVNTICPTLVFFKAKLKMGLLQATSKGGKQHSSLSPHCYLFTSSIQPPPMTILSPIALTAIFLNSIAPEVTSRYQ